MTKTPPTLRICSLLPSATEIVGRLGLADRLVAVTHECDVAPDAATLDAAIASGAVRRVTSSAIDPSALSQADIDALVKGSVRNAQSLYGVDVATFHDCAPSLVISQGLCDVCGPSTSQVADACAASDGLGRQQRRDSAGEQHPRIVSLEPENLAQVGDTFEQVARAAGVAAAGVELRRTFLAGLRAVSDAVRANRPPAARSAYVLEWLDPPFDAGHWVPEILEIAMGNFDKTSCAGWEAADAGRSDAQPNTLTPTAERPLALCKWSQRKSRQVSWESVNAADPDVLVVSCCGFDCPRNVRDAQRVLAREDGARELRACRTCRVHAMDGNRYLARPGPALLEGAAALAMCVWADCPVVLQALRATGHVPSVDRFQHVDVSSLAAQPHTRSGKDGALEGAAQAAAGSQGSFVGDVVRGAAGIVDVEDATADRSSWMRLHEAAVAKGEHLYTDPESGLLVMTKVAHLARGRCCGSGCRHCPFAHERVPLDKRASNIVQPAWLWNPASTNPRGAQARCSESDSDAAEGARPAVVLFWSTGKDSFLALRALQRSADTKGAVIVLLTTFDATSRTIAHQETSVDDAVAQAKALGTALVGVPLQRGGLPYSESVRAGIQLVRARYRGIRALAFGDLHLDHIRAWRESAALHSATDGESLWFPIWHVNYDDLLQDLEEAHAEARVSAVTGRAHGIVHVGDVFGRALYDRAVAAGLDGFGENGEFHTVVRVRDDRGMAMS